MHLKNERKRVFRTKIVIFHLIEGSIFDPKMAMFAVKTCLDRSETMKNGFYRNSPYISHFGAAQGKKDREKR